MIGEALTFTNHCAFDPDMGRKDTAIMDDKNRFMEYLATFISKGSTILVKSNTLPGSKEAYSDTSNDFNRTVRLDFRGTIDWTDFAIERLDEVYNECSEANWDGYGAKPISHETYFEARKLLTMIPLSFLMPEILAEPDGEIGFEWYKDKDSVFVISVSGNNIITYAGLFGTSNKTHGTECFADELPRIILENIRRLFS